MVKQKAKERRNFVRAKRVLSIQYRIKKTLRKSSDKSWHVSLTKDMSYNGISFLTEQEFVKGDILEIKVVMSGIIDIFAGCGEVTRVEKKKKNAALRLVALNLSDRSSNIPSKSSRNLKTARSAKRV